MLNRTHHSIVGGMLLNACLSLWACLSNPNFVLAQNGAPQNSAAERGYRFLLEQPLLPAIDFDEETLLEVWHIWPEALRREAEKATEEQRRKMIFDRYGLTPRPEDPDKPLQYVVNAEGGWTMNCFACHGGRVDDQVYPGAPNQEFDLQSLTEEIRLSKLRLGKGMSRMDVGSVFMPLSGSRGTTNSVMFGVALMYYRDADLNVINPGFPPSMAHHDMDAPPWWHFAIRDRIYIDGFVAKSHRPLMQFALVRENGPDWFHRYEEPFKDVAAYLESIKPPAYPHSVDFAKASNGEKVFGTHCAECHGTYGVNRKYPQRHVAINEIGTDPLRLHALAPAWRKRHGESWFAAENQIETIVEPIGYVAPPLDGVWASAPYFHNGSVPTLWHVLHPKERPKLWRKTGEGWDKTKVGVAYEVAEKIPSADQDRVSRRRYFDTRMTGKSAEGHDFAEVLSENERDAVLEYLKTL